MNSLGYPSGIRRQLQDPWARAHGAWGLVPSTSPGFHRAFVEHFKTRFYLALGVQYFRGSSKYRWRTSPDPKGFKAQTELFQVRYGKGGFGGTPTPPHPFTYAYMLCLRALTLVGRRIHSSNSTRPQQVGVHLLCPFALSF